MYSCMRIPRQAPGEALVPVTVLVPPEVRAWLTELALDEQRSVSWVVRNILKTAQVTAARDETELDARLT